MDDKQLLQHPERQISKEVQTPKDFAESSMNTQYVATFDSLDISLNEDLNFNAKSRRAGPKSKLGL